jgi:hypothetical protein
MKEASRATALEIEQAAIYLARLNFRPWIRVVETRTVPRTRAAFYGWLYTIPGGGVEPIDQRMIEVAEDDSRAGLYDPASGGVAYVPVGSVKRSETLVAMWLRVRKRPQCYVLRFPSRLDRIACFAPSFHTPVQRHRTLKSHLTQGCRRER